MGLLELCVGVLLVVLVLARDHFRTATEFPPRIFQTWKSHTDIPSNMAYWKSTWIHHHPTFTYELWDDAQNRAFVEKEFPWFLPTYDGYDREIKRADAIRYMYLYKFGGIYADMDFECLQSLEPLLRSYQGSADVLLGSMETTWTHRRHSIPNAILISKPQQDFWLTLLKALEQAAEQNPQGDVEELTGPVILHKTYWKTWSGSTRICVLPAHLFYPLSWSSANSKRLHALHRSKSSPQRLTEEMKATYPTSYAITYWTHSW